MKYFHDKKGYYALFDEQNGTLIRGGINNTDPFWKESGPELLDISITNFCERKCNFCYRSSNANGNFMSLLLYEHIMQEAKDVGVFQVALGGGNPNQHPKFIEILRMTREYGIVPSYTTNGHGMTEEIYEASKKYVGAIAVSWYEPYVDTVDVLKKCSDYGIQVNIHFVLYEDNIEEARKLLESDCIKYANAIIFLNYKPVGVEKKKVLRKSYKLYHFLHEVIHFKKCKIGFDSCMIPYLMPFLGYMDYRSIDYCEAARFSAFISEDGLMYPCSFMCGAKDQGYSLLNTKMVDIWKTSPNFVRYRELLSTRPDRCISCDKYEFCHGGCHRFDINCT